jgi:hypothetical protein
MSSGTSMQMIKGDVSINPQEIGISNYKDIFMATVNDALEIQELWQLIKKLPNTLLELCYNRL